MRIPDKIRQMPATRRRALTLFVGVCLVILLFFGFRWLTEWRFLITTDDAYVQGDIAAIAPKLDAYIKEVTVKANQSVKRNDILFVLDDGDYRIALAEAEAKLKTQKRTLERIQQEVIAAEANLEQTKASKISAQAVAVNAGLVFERAQSLQKQQYVPQSSVDKARSDLAQAQADIVKADAQIDTAQANIGVLQAQYNEIASQTASLSLTRDKAMRDLNFTIIRAPFDGIVGNLTGKKGDFVTNGQKIAALVPTHELYIDANYKETQLDNIYGGETAYISIDGYEGGRFAGKVLSLAPATGAVFSILPPQNATGNFTKVVQRVPVRIAIPEDVLATGRVRAGMSAVIEIDSRTRDKTALPIGAIPANSQPTQIKHEQAE